MGTYRDMEGNDEGDQHVVGGLDAPFLSGPQGTAPRSHIGPEASDGINHVLPEQEEEEGPRTITMIVFRDGNAWEAEATIEDGEEGSIEWWAAAIACLDTSVDMAVAEL